jgi:hypothetical protein
MRIREINEGIITDFLGKQINKALSKNLDSQTATIFKDTFSKKVKSAITNAISSGLIDLKRPDTSLRFLSNLVNSHMKGVNLGSYKDDVENSIKSLNANIGTGNYRNELTKLAELLYSVSVADAGPDPEKTDISSNTDKLSASIKSMTGANNSDDLEKIIKDTLMQLWKVDKTKYLNVLNRLKKINPK